MKRKVLIACALSVFLALVGIWLVGSVLTAASHEAVGGLPPDLTGRSVEFASPSGATLHGWFIPGVKGQGAIALMHGVRANRLSMVDRARFLSRAGYAVLLFDFQAHGESTGKKITFGYLESKDAQAAIHVLRANAPGEKIGVIGVSMGGAAVLLSNPPLDVNAAVLEMVYPNINQAIKDRLQAHLGSWAGALTPLLSWQLKPRLGISADDLRPIDEVSAFAVPKLFIAGEQDKHTTLLESQEMFRAAAEPKELWVVPRGEHVDLYPLAKDEYERRVLGFFGKFLRK